jgi:hypothetical protein
MIIAQSAGTRAPAGASMNHKNRIQLVVAIAATAALCGFANAATPQHTEDTAQQSAKELDATRNAWLECVRTAIPRLDHPESTSEAVARAAMNSCSDQYAAVLGALSRTLVPSCDRDSDCTRAARAKSEHEAIRAATDEVVTARIRVAGAQVLICQ